MPDTGDLIGEIVSFQKNIFFLPTYKENILLRMNKISRNCLYGMMSTRLFHKKGESYELSKLTFPYVDFLKRSYWSVKCIYIFPLKDWVREKKLMLKEVSTQNKPFPCMKPLILDVALHVHVTISPRVSLARSSINQDLNSLSPMYKPCTQYSLSS